MSTALRSVSLTTTVGLSVCVAMSTLVVVVWGGGCAVGCVIAWINSSIIVPISAFLSLEILFACDNWWKAALALVMRLLRFSVLPMATRLEVLVAMVMVVLPGVAIAVDSMEPSVGHHRGERISLPLRA